MGFLDSLAFAGNTLDAAQVARNRDRDAQLRETLATLRAQQEQQSLLDQDIMRKAQGAAMAGLLAPAQSAPMQSAPMPSGPVAGPLGPQPPMPGTIPQAPAGPAPPAAPTPPTPPGGAPAMPQGGAPSLPAMPQIPAAFDVPALASRIKAQNPDMDNVTLFHALAQTQQLLNPEGKLQMQLLLSEMRDKSLLDRLQLQDEQRRGLLTQREEFDRWKTEFIQDMTSRRQDSREQGVNQRFDRSQSGIEGRFERREQGREARGAATADVKTLQSERRTLMDERASINRRRADIKANNAGMPPEPGTKEYAELVKLTGQVNQLDQKIQEKDKAITGAQRRPKVAPEPSEGDEGDGSNPAADGSLYKSASDVAAAYKAGKLDYDEAHQILVENGWADQ